MDVGLVIFIKYLKSIELCVRFRIYLKEMIDIAQKSTLMYSKTITKFLVIYCTEQYAWHTWLYLEDNLNFIKNLFKARCSKRDL